MRQNISLIRESLAQQAIRSKFSPRSGWNESRKHLNVKAIGGRILFAMSCASLVCPVSAAELEEVIVSASKRAESEFDLPLSLEVFTGEKIKADGITTLDDLSARAPNVTFANGLTQATISIRGQGSGADRSFEQSVAMFIDDVYMPRSRQYRTPFFDMERVEILRGPQALLFGLNATAGTVNITTATSRPGDAAILEMSGGYETEFSGFNASAIAGGALGTNVGARLAVRYADTGDGIYFNEFTDREENNSEEILIRGTLVWDAQDDLTFTAKGMYVAADEHGNFGETYGLASPAYGDGVLNYRRNSDARYLKLLTDEDPGFDHEILNASLRFDYDFHGHVLTGIGAYSMSDYDFVVEIGNLPAGLNSQGAALYEELDQLSAELRLASPIANTLSYIVGVYVAENELVNAQPNVYGNVFAGAYPAGATALLSNAIGYTDTSTQSVFASLTWSITDSFRLTGGARYSVEEKENRRETPLCQAYSGLPGAYTFLSDLPLIAPQLNLCGTLDGFADSRSGSNLMPELVAQWDFVEHSTVYAKIGKSAKSGGYALGTSVVAELIEFDDEIAKTAEIGLKSRLLDGRASVKLAAYSTRFEDLQLTSFEFVGATIVAGVGNAGESESKGIEVELNLAATDWLKLGSSLAYLDSKYTDFPNGACYIGETATRNPVTGSCNKKGQSTPNAPEYSGSVFADVAFHLSDYLVLTGGAALSFSDEYFTTSTIDPAAIQESYTRWDARIGLAQTDGDWEISVIGKNLANELINNFTQPLASLAYLGFPYAPRTITLQSTFRF